MYINREIKVNFKNFKNKCDFFCALCNFPLQLFQDFETSEEWDGVCRECYLTFVESRRNKWKEGWRPDKETLEEYIYTRKRNLIPQEKK